MIYFTGDIHGDAIERFTDWNFNKEDIVFILGDCGIPWGSRYIDNDINQLSFLSSFNCTFIFIAGNHDNYDLIENMPEIKKFNGILKKMVYLNKEYPNIFYINKPQILFIKDKKYLIIPGAESHDIEDGILQNDENLDFNIEHLIFSGKTHFRIKGVSWWPQEKIDKDEVLKITKEFKEVDYILSHDYPNIVNSFCTRPGYFFRLAGTESEKFLETIREKINYNCWLHGHIHAFHNWYKYNIISLYGQILNENEIQKILNLNQEKNNDKENKDDRPFTHCNDGASWSWEELYR